jgi:heme exporter protein C
MLPGWTKQMWWKYMAIILLVYVLIGGLTVPLGPGLVSINPMSFTPAAENNFTIEAANTHFQSGKNVQVFLKSAGKYLCVENAKATSETSLSFMLPVVQLANAEKDDNTFDVIVNDDADGTIALRDALVMNGSAPDSLHANECVVAVVNNLHTGFAFPYREILYESIRNTFYHVPMWFSMLLVLIVSLVYSIKYLSSNNKLYDIIAAESVNVSLLCGGLGIVTGMMWANYTWGSPWPNDPKLNGAAVGILIYLAYIILRGAIQDEVKRARISAVYNIFAIVIYILFIFIIPRITDSLHPGNGGNPAFSKYDLDSHLRLFFYPAVIGWVLLFMWLVSIRVRIRFLEEKKLDNE